MASSGQNNSTPQVKFHIGCLALLLSFVGLPMVFFESVKIAHNILQQPVISSLYGSQAYANGLRVTGRQGQLSDGRRLPSGWNTTLGFCAFILSMPAWLGYCGILAAFGLFPLDRVFNKGQKRARGR